MKMLVSMLIVVAGMRFFGPRLGDTFDDILRWTNMLYKFEIIELDDES